MAFRKIVGVDAGYVNFAVCAFRTDKVTTPYYWTNTPLFEGKFSEERLVKAIYTWITQPEIKQLLDEADEIILERQMTMKFQAVNHCIRFCYFNKTKEVNPNTVGAFFSLPEKRREKKKAGVELVSRHAVMPVKKGKKDDLADAYLLAFYGAVQTQPELGHQWLALEQPDRKKRKVVLDCT